MGLTKLVIRGARQHNLKNISVEIPRNSLTVITGLSGSGKSSLAFDTIYAEGQRRYVESLSAYARQFLDQMERPEVDVIEGLSPSIAIEQKTTTRSPRSTVGTITEIYDYLRVIYATVGVPHCPNCGLPITRQSSEQIVQSILHGEICKPDDRIMILAPIVRGRKGAFRKELEKFAQDGYVRVRINGELFPLDNLPVIDKRKNHTIEMVIDRLLVKPGISARLEQSIATALKLASGLVTVAIVGGKEHTFSEKLACPDCGISVPQLEPRSFSFNSPYGACPACNGLGSKYDFDPSRIINDRSRPLFDGGLGPGSSSAILKRTLELGAYAHGFDLETPFDKFPARIQNMLLYGYPPSNRSAAEENGSAKKPKGEKGFRFPGVLKFLERNFEESGSDTYREWMTQYMSATLCSVCHGKRLRPESLAVKLAGWSVADFTALSLSAARPAVDKILTQLTERQKEIAARPLEEVSERIDFLLAVGLGYLSLDRSAATLSGGEAQRIRLATQIGSRLRGVLYVLDEPSIGLHARDNARLLGSLEHLRNLGNTVLVVEHDEDTIRRADFVVDLGPGAGNAGGYLVAQGRPAEIEATAESLTGQYLSGKAKIAVPEKRRSPNGKAIQILGASANNLKEVDVTFPLGLLTVVTGVSGSGKSTLVNDILYRALAQKLYRSSEAPAAHREIIGAEHIDKVIEIDQAPIGRTPRSNPATYTGVFGPIRDLFAMLPESRERGYRPGRFSFNVKGGRCEACQGDGLRRIEMNFLPDVYVMCEVCRGRRYNSETLAVRYKGHAISDVLNLPSSDALKLLENIPQIQQKLATLVEVGLGYVTLGQSATTLSGGEAQRIKLARELSKRQTGRTLYILDEPTTGLHFDDVRKLLDVLQRLVDLGNTVLIIEHHLDVIKQADWIIDLGPEGGEGGGRIVAQGPPELVARAKKSYTGQALARVLPLNGHASGNFPNGHSK
ncbi:MAG: excinuclease ABC subunit A [Acidobacteria bacterium 13_1_20CM_3_58_11]|nr:MAG: excinuclease ABC subunit A [Acidobacteria bacterium 13_1_20CM_58_21]OLE46780.1 MAG: excinuclease ABC subunit A [Acidobacteria bacterium 13_1_20CM_3_58_11]